MFSAAAKLQVSGGQCRQKEYQMKPAGRHEYFRDGPKPFAGSRVDAIPPG
jgi:hypothetical protein